MKPPIKSNNMSKLDNSRLTDNFSQQSPLKFGGKGEESNLN